MVLPTKTELEATIDRALAEDLYGGDVTTNALIPPHIEATANIVPKEPGVIAGMEVSLLVFRRVDPDLEVTLRLLDGDQVEGGETLATVSGRFSSILTAERTALNYLRHMSGVATMTSKFVAKVADTDTVIVDTRKTTPGMRLLDKYAVAIGGGRNHRSNLSDGVLIKDNHIEALQAEGFSLQQIVRRARARAPHTLRIEVEIETVEEVRAAIEAGADIILLDNMSTDDMRVAVELANDKCLTEASGDVTLDRVADIAATGVDMISVGALTHSAPALNISLDYSPVA